MSAIRVVVREIVENNRNTISNFTNKAFDDEVNSTREKESERSLKLIERSCLMFCISLLNQQITNHEYDSSLICALTILRVKKNEWLSSNRYSFILSTMIKISRMMMIQQTWKQCDQTKSRQSSINNSSHVSSSNSSSSINSISNFDSSYSEIHHDSDEKITRINSADSSEILQKVRQMIDQFMIRDSHDSMQWMLNLRTYELKIHYNTISESHVNWVENTILYKQI